MLHVYALVAEMERDFISAEKSSMSVATYESRRLSLSRLSSDAPNTVDEHPSRS